MEYGCIAEKLGHSFSKRIHAQIDDYAYELREVPQDALREFMLRRDFRGINVTIPYKQAVIPYLDGISDTAKAIGAVNTIRNTDGRLYGDNTDFYGMTALLRKMGLSLRDKKVLILGAGGTSKTANAVAQRLHASEILTVSRTAKADAVTYEDVYARHTDAQIILNTTPVGMFPDVDGCAMDLTAFSRLEGVLDAVYNPLRTKLVLSARERRVRAEGGLYMLIAQAVAAAEIFTGKKYAPELADSIFRELTRQTENLVLIGMPSSGKTTLGKAAAERLGRPFVDLDERVAERDGRPIPQIFAEDGEAYFRDLESRVVREIAPQNGLVIATGGGCVLRQENVRYLRMNGKLILLDRPLDALSPTDDRPTADSVEKMRALYQKRAPFYRAAADKTVPVGGDLAENTANVLRCFTEDSQ